MDEASMFLFRWLHYFLAARLVSCLAEMLMTSPDNLLPLRKSLRSSNNLPFNSCPPYAQSHLRLRYYAVSCTSIIGWWPWNCSQNNPNASMIQAPVSHHDSDPILPESESKRLSHFIISNHVYHSCSRCRRSAFEHDNKWSFLIWDYYRIVERHFGWKYSFLNYTSATELSLIRWRTPWKEFAIRTFVNIPSICFVLLCI